jgi:hypothetical protein
MERPNGIISRLLMDFLFKGTGLVVHELLEFFEEWMYSLV